MDSFDGIGRNEEESNGKCGGKPAATAAATEELEQALVVFQLRNRRDSGLLVKYPEGSSSRLICCC
jgi:hypothetical protein